MLKSLARILLLPAVLPIILMTLYPFAEWIDLRIGSGGWSGFTKTYAPLVAITVFFVSSILVHLTITRHTRPGSPIWVGIDGVWVMTSVAAFVLTAWASSSEIIVKKAEDQIKVLEAGSAQVPLRIDAFLDEYCFSGQRVLYTKLASDEVTTCQNLLLESYCVSFQRDFLPTLTPDELATCQFAESRRTTTEKIAERVNWGAYENAVPSYGASGIITESLTALTVAWSGVEREVHLFGDAIRAFNEQRPSYLEALRNARLRLVWVWVFPLVAGLRLNKALADYRKAKG